MYNTIYNQVELINGLNYKVLISQTNGFPIDDI
jgi:hypothetical protein